MSLKCMHIGVLVFLFLMSVVNNIAIEPNEVMLPEISNNISLVNHLLQDLMKKYELLKHLTNTEMDKISHNTNKTLNGFVQMKSHFKIRAKDTTKEPNKTLSATKTYSDQSTEDDVSDVHKKKTLRGKGNPKKINNKGHNRPGDTKVQYPVGYPLKSEGKSVFFTDESCENNNNETHFKSKPRKNKVFDKKDTVSSDSEEDTFVTKKSQRSTTQKKYKLKENLKQKRITTTKDYSDEEIPRGSPKESEDSKDVKKVLVIHLDNNKNPNVNQLRTSNPNKVKIPSTKKKQRTRESTTRLIKSDITTDSNSDLEEHKVMEEEILRAKSLRQALGDACIILVCRKCKKALKEVLKDICKKDRKCSSNFNKDFTENGIAACDEEFNNPNGKTVRNVHQDKYFRDYDDESENDDRGQDGGGEVTGAFVDYTRQGLLDMTCLQAISDVKKPNIVGRTNLTKIDNKTHDVHILRDKLENACRKTSFDKCYKACNSASDKTCKKHECVSAKKKALKKSCKKRCTESYGYEEKSSSESESDEDSDEDSKSD